MSLTATKEELAVVIDELVQEEAIGLDKKGVEDWLKEVDYEDDPDYMPSDFALEFVNFIKLVNGEDGEENVTPVIHYKMLDNIQYNDKDTINMCHRGVAKTTVLGTYMILYCAVYGDIPGFGKVPYVLYVSDAVENGVKKMRKDLEFRWDNSAFLQEWLPYKRLTDVRWEFANKDKVHFVCTGHGAKTGVRGTRELGTRPLLAILDDLISDDDARSPTVISSVEDTVYKAVDYALHPVRRKIIWSGTPFNARDPLYKAVESGAWHVNVYPICEKFPCSRKDFRGSWINRFSFDYVQKQYTKAMLSHKIDTFNQELMLRIMSEEDRLITDDEILWYGRDLLIQNKDAYNFYITTDFATSEKQAADFSVIMVWAYNAKGQWFWVDGVCKKQTMDVTMNDLFRLAQKWNPQQVGIEISGQQQAFIPWIQDQMMIRKCWFNLAKDKDQTKPGIRPNTDKMKRFNIVVPWFKSGMIFFPREMQLMPIMGEIVDELSLISLKGMKSRNDDTNDAVSMLANLSPWRPSEQLPPEEEGENIWETEAAKSDISGMDSYTV